MDSSTDELLTVEEVAKKLRLRPRAIYNYIDSGMFEIVRCSQKAIRIKKSSFDKFIANGGIKKE